MPEFPYGNTRIGLPLSLYWFWRHGQKNGPLSRQLALALAAVLAYGVLFAALTWYIMSPEAIASYTEIYPQTMPWTILLQRYMLTVGGAACALVALAGLVLAKCCDRRWLALYALEVTVAVMAGFCPSGRLVCSGRGWPCAEERPAGAVPAPAAVRGDKYGYEVLTPLRADWRHMRDAIASFGVE